jgi:L-seryl-tRNA(Ser) seleniumtransferase
MMRLTEEQLTHRARQLAEQLREECPELQIEVLESRSLIGGGSAPGSTLPTRAVALKSEQMNAGELLRRLREWETPIIARVDEERLLLDPRTVEPAQEAVIVAAMKRISQ